MIFICTRMKNDFHMKGWAPTLVLKQRPGGTRKWPISLRMQLSLLKGTRRDGSISPHVRESGFQYPWKVCWWNPESSALESGIHLKESGIPLTIGIQNPRFHWQRLESSSWNPVSKNVLDFQWGYTIYVIERALRIQLFRERFSEKVHATIPKGFVGSFEFTVLQKNLKDWQERPWTFVCEC